MAIAHVLWIEHFGAELGDIGRTDVGGLLQTTAETRVFRTTWSDYIEVGGGRFSVDAQPNVNHRAYWRLVSQRSRAAKHDGLHGFSSKAGSHVVPTQLAAAAVGLSCALFLC